MKIILATFLMLLGHAAHAHTTIINNYYGDRSERRAHPLNHCFYRVCQYTCTTRTWWQVAPCPAYTIVIR